MKMLRLIAASALLAVALAAQALPTVDAVQAQVKSGNYAQAEVMMQDVVIAKPNSARAHYLYAEILAHNQRFEQAAREAGRARDIDPALGFTDAAKFNSFMALLQRQQAATAVPAPAANTGAAADNSGLPTRHAAAPVQAPATPGVPMWAWAMGLAGIAAVVWAVVSRRQQAAALGQPPMAMAGNGYGQAVATPPGFGGGMGNGYGNGGQPGFGGAGGFGNGYPAQQAPGRGLMGVGLGVAGGVAAGMLAERLLHGDDNRSSGHAGSNWNDGGGNGLTPGAFGPGAGDSPAAHELEQRPIDFGSGADWGGDAGGDGAGSSDDSSGGDGGW
jgi:hypothetical protein